MAEALFLCAVLGSVPAIIVGAIGLAMLLNHRRLRRWTDAARQLGMEMQGTPGKWFPLYQQHPLRGHRGGVPVELAVRVVSSGSGRNRSQTYYTYALVELPRALGLGLSVRSHGIVASWLSGVVAGQDLQLGDAEIDPRYAIHAAEPERARQLLLTPYVREALLARAGDGTTYISDRDVRVELRGQYFHPDTLSRLMDGAVDLARRLVAARAEVGETTAERVLETTWRSVAASHGLAFEPGAQRMHGRVNGVHVEVATTLEGAGRTTRFTARFDRPLGVGLQLTREGSFTAVKRLLGMQDIQLGDAAFDARFVVRGAPEAAVRALLGPDARARLAALQEQATELRVEDDHLSAEVGWLVAEESWLVSGIASIAAAAGALAGAPRTPIGPFRS